VDLNPRDYRAWYGLGQTYELLHMPYYALHYFRRATQARAAPPCPTAPPCPLQPRRAAQARRAGRAAPGARAAPPAAPRALGRAGRRRACAHAC